MVVVERRRLPYSKGSDVLMVEVDLVEGEPSLSELPGGGSDCREPPLW